MKDRILILAARILLRFLDIPREGKRDQQVEDWLVASWQTPGFRKYLAHRNGQFVDELTGGTGLTERSRDEYARLFSRRMELLLLGAQARTAYLNKQKRDERKLKELSTTPSPENT